MTRGTLQRAAVRRALLAAGLAGTVALTGASAPVAAGTDPTPMPSTPAADPDQPPAFASVARALTLAERHAMTPSVWRRGCPVRLRDLRVVAADRWRFDGQVGGGRLVVNADAADAVQTLLAAWFAAGYPIRRMVPIQRFGGDDYASIEADNTSAFNCRFVDGTHRWSRHAYGRAIDVNPLENPYVSRGRTSHSASTTYVRRIPLRPGMLAEGTAALAAVDAVGWGWGGRWRGFKDYQHVSADGR